VLTPDSFRTRKANGVLKEFERLKNEGLVKHICVSTHMTGAEIGDMLNDYPFAGVLLGYSAMNFAYREAGLEAAARHKIGVVVMNPLGGGIITQHPDRFNFLKTRTNETVVDGALRFLLSDPRITIALVGLGNQQHLADAILAVEGFQPIIQEKINFIRASLKDSFDQLCTGCRYCDNCPERIPIPKLMEAYNHFLLNQKRKDLLDRLYWHWGISTKDDYSSRCVECGQCEDECTQKLPIIQRLKNIKYEIDNYLREKN
jgi:predicted aldo/keto reductase-like oxidoreductase